MREIWSYFGKYSEYIVDENETCILHSGNKCQMEKNDEIVGHITV